MPSPKRSAPRRTAAALAEDLVQARKVGGIWKADDTDLVATLDFLELTGVSSSETPLARARDLLASHIRRVCEQYQEQHTPDRTAAAAAASLRELLLRPATDDRIAQTIRRDAAKAVGHSVSPDAVRHRESAIIRAIGQDVFADLQAQDTTVAQTVEAAIHQLAPLASDLRQDLHDLLCMTYMGVQPKSPHEQRIIDGTHHEVIINLGRLLIVCERLISIAMLRGNLSGADNQFLIKARAIRSIVFSEFNDQVQMQELLGQTGTRNSEAIERLLSTEAGQAMYDRYIGWMKSCFATCAFERTTELHLMCEPHELVTLLYDTEIIYNQQGYSELRIPGNQPMLHHRLNPDEMKQRTARAASARTKRGEDQS